MSIKEIRDKSRVGAFALFDFAVTYTIVIIIWFVLLLTNTFLGSGLWLLRFLLLVFPLSVIVHVLFKQKTALTEMTLDKNLNYVGSVTSKSILIISLVALVFI